ncbi:MFS sugar transporter protein [Rutstroemia sp. NJR-2017a WRK4]|nr:MFS sugar transporter protein [Rutstroemia sp. NJR-2017a WRK4]
MSHIKRIWSVPSKSDCGTSMRSPRARSRGNRTSNGCALPLRFLLCRNLAHKYGAEAGYKSQTHRLDSSGQSNNVLVHGHRTYGLFGDCPLGNNLSWIITAFFFYPETAHRPLESIKAMSPAKSPSHQRTEITYQATADRDSPHRAPASE